MNQSFLFFELIGIFIVHWLILEPQTYVDVEQFGAENNPLLSGRLVFFYKICQDFIYIKAKGFHPENSAHINLASCDLYLWRFPDFLVDPKDPKIT